jgi:hypothetical protein
VNVHILSFGVDEAVHIRHVVNHCTTKFQLVDVPERRRDDEGKPIDAGAVYCFSSEQMVWSLGLCVKYWYSSFSARKNALLCEAILLGFRVIVDIFHLHSVCKI